MAGIMEKIFPLDSSLDILSDYMRTKLSTIPSVLVTGPPKSQKTSLLMQAAVTEGEKGGQVLFVAPKKFSRLPPSIHGMPQPSSSAMNNIRFLYASCTTELYRYLASLHMMPAKDRPNLIIVDDLQFYSTPPDCGDAPTQMVNAARILSLAQESAKFCSTHSTEEDDKNADSSTAIQCSVLVAWTQRSSDFLKQTELEVFAGNFCHHVWTIHPKQKGKTGDKTEYTLKQNLSGATCAICFSGHHIGRPSNYIVFHEVTLEQEGEEEQNLNTSDRKSQTANSKGTEISTLLSM